MQHSQLPWLAMLPIAAVLSVTTACAPADRDRQLADIQRWQEQRLAPVDSLSALIAGTDAHVRRAAVRAAGLIGRTENLPAMLGALDDPSRAVRCEAAFSLGLLGGDVAVTPLARLLADPHPAVREAAIAGLAHQQHDGAVLYTPALHGRAAEAQAAWTALRNVAGQAPRDSLVAAIRSGLARPETDVRWRVLRCAERAPDPTLVDQIAPYATDRDVQVRVHALRALANQSGAGALAAVLASCEQSSGLRGRDRSRVQIAELRALGNLAGPAMQADPAADHASPAGRTAAVLQQAAGSEDPAVAATALDAATAAALALPLPPEAAAQESLLPVWRLRLVRAARQRLADPTPAVRTAAVAALGALRGRGALAELSACLADPDAVTAGAALGALLRLVPQHDQVCDWTQALARQQGIAGEIAVLEALPALVSELRRAGLLHQPVTRFPRRQDPGCLPSLAWWLAVRGMQSGDVALRALAAPILAEFPGDASRRAVVAAWPREMAQGEGDIQLALLQAIARLFAPAADSLDFAPHRRECLFFATALVPEIAGSALDSLLSRPGPAASRTAAAEALVAAFDLPDLRLRLAAREAALATDLLPATLIPSAASLRETLPARRRPPQQLRPQPATGALRVRCVTDRGDFEMKLATEIAPAVTAAFLALIDQGFHDGLTFHRVVSDFVIQGGCPRGDGWGGPGWTLPSEWSRRPFARGTVGLAHSGKDTGGSQWFVCLSPQPHLDGRYTVFGEVTAGLDVLDRIQRGDRYRLEIVGR